MTRKGYVTLDEAARQIGVTRSTLHYYIRTLNLQTHKFQLDRKAYLTEADFRAIKQLKDDAAGSTEEESVA